MKLDVNKILGIREPDPTSAARRPFGLPPYGYGASFPITRPEDPAVKAFNPTELAEAIVAQADVTEARALLVDDGRHVVVWWKEMPSGVLEFVGLLLKLVGQRVPLSA